MMGPRKEEETEGEIVGGGKYEKQRKIAIKSSKLIERTTPSFQIGERRKRENGRGKKEELGAV